MYYGSTVTVQYYSYSTVLQLQYSITVRLLANYSIFKQFELKGVVHESHLPTFIHPTVTWLVSFALDAHVLHTKPTVQ